MPHDPMTAASLLELAERVEHRERERVPLALEKEIASAFGHGTYRPYTTSLDAALTLVPEEWTAWEIRSRRRKTAFVAELSRMVTADDESYQIGRSSHTPAAALVAACLRARAQKEQKDD